jgi:hypothetical protein
LAVVWVCEARAGCGGAHDSRSAKLTYDFHAERLGREAVGHHFQAARSGFDAGRDVEFGGAVCLQADGHWAGIVRSSIEDVPGREICDAHKRIAADWAWSPYAARTDSPFRRSPVS